MPFSDPIVAGDELIHSRIRSANYQQGLLGWAINKDGSAEFNAPGSFQSLTAADSFYYKGQELSDILSPFSQGIVGLNWLNTGGTTRTVALGTEQMLFQTQFTFHTNKRYILYFGGHRVQNTTVNNHWYIYHARDAAAGNCRTSDGPANWCYEKRLWGANIWDGCGPIFQEITGYIQGIVADGHQLNLGIGVNGAGGTLSFFPGDDWIFAVIDAGYWNPNIGVDLWTAPLAPSLNYKTFQTSAIDSQSFQGGGNASNGSGSSNADRMYYGQDPGYAPNGNWKSLAWFNKADTGGGNGLGSLNDMNGATTANVNYLDVYINTPWWYYTNGGTLLLGMTGSGATHGVYPGGTADIVEVGYTARGQGQWINVKGTSIETAILNGTFTGIQLGPGKDTSYGWYGYALGAAHAGAAGPAIRGGYYK